VVVDDVEQDLEARGVERADHLLELGDGVARGRVLVVRGEAADRLVAPVVAQAAGDERADLSLVAFPKAPYRVTVSRIPFGP